MSQEIEGSRPVELLVAWAKKKGGALKHAQLLWLSGMALPWKIVCMLRIECKKWKKVSVNASVALHILLHIHFHAFVS